VGVGVDEGESEERSITLTHTHSHPRYDMFSFLLFRLFICRLTEEMICVRIRIKENIL
jgi:hypothetical protein